MKTITKYWQMMVILFAMFAGLYWVTIQLTTSANAADLGGNCCADLEERIAELEATTARKGNRKVALQVYGQVNKSMLAWDADDATYSGSASLNGVSLGSISGSIAGSGGSNQRIIDNGVDPSFVGFSGRAQISQGVSAGYVMELGVGGYAEDGALGGNTNNIYVQKSYFWLKNDALGALSVGLTGQATDDLDKVTTANTAVAMRPLSLLPLTGPETGEALDLFDGNRSNLVRYDSPVWAGFVVSASWTPGDEDDSVDIALRYGGEFEGFKLAAGVGYRQGIVINGDGSTDVIDEDFVDLDTWTVTGSVMHVVSGLFVSGTYGSGDGEVLNGLTSTFNVSSISAETTGWQINGGLERKWFEIGKSTLYAEYGDVEAEAEWAQTFAPVSVSVNGSVGYTYWGLGVVQSIDAAAMDVFATVRFYEFDASLSGSATNGVDTLSGNINAGQDATVGQIGARIKF
jgi:predicted porin